MRWPAGVVRRAARETLIITSNRAPSDWYPLFSNPVVAESLLDRLINTSHWKPACRADSLGWAKPGAKIHHLALQLARTAPFHRARPSKASSVRTS